MKISETKREIDTQICLASGCKGHAKEGLQMSNTDLWSLSLRLMNWFYFPEFKNVITDILMQNMHFRSVIAADIKPRKLCAKHKVLKCDWFVFEFRRYLDRTKGEKLIFYIYAGRNTET